MQNEQILSGANGSYYWQTDYSHADNTITMLDFLNNHLALGQSVVLYDGSYCEVKNADNGKLFSLHAKGNGDSYNHCVEWEQITNNKQNTMSVKEFLESKNIYVLTYIATQENPENYYSLAELLDEYL